MRFTATRTLAAVTMAAVLVGCSSVGEPTARQNEQDGPAFTEAEKAEMTTEQKVAVYNEQQEEKDQLVCRRERPVGSRMIKTVCYTRAEIEEMSRDAQDQVGPAKGYSQGAGN
jgi:negative regulator of sigma E activity